jgi:hypothetical protein
MNYVWLAPGRLEYFYRNATDNDFFLGALSGPGYMYPKAIPSSMLPTVIDIAAEMMHELDLVRHLRFVLCYVMLCCVVLCCVVLCCVVLCRFVLCCALQCFS